MGKFSISRVNTFLENPWKHWCKYIAGYKPLPNPEHTKYMDRGTVFHRAMELLSSSKGTVGWSSVEEVVIKEAQEAGFLEEAYQSGITAVDRYLTEYGEQNPFKNVIETEYELNYILQDGHEFIGFVDAILDNGDGTVTLVDYKTYSKSPDPDKLKYSLQANMYMYVATQLGFNVKKFVFDCVNPSAKLTGRQYRTKRVEFFYNKHRAQDYFEQFCMIVDIINNNPEYRVYTLGDYRPDTYDYLYKVYVGDIMEDLDEYIEKNFEKNKEN